MTPGTPLPLLLTPRNAAKALPVCEKTLWTFAKGGRFQVVCAGRATRHEWRILSDSSTAGGGTAVRNDHQQNGSRATRPAPASRVVCGEGALRPVSFATPDPVRRVRSIERDSPGVVGAVHESNEGYPAACHRGKAVRHV
jgi:hypothetical protein